MGCTVSTGVRVSSSESFDHSQSLLANSTPPIDESALDHSSLMAFAAPAPSGNPTPAGRRAPAAALPREMKKIQPNLYLANERTFLNWTNLSLTFAAVGAAAISVGEKVAGYIIVLLGMFICFRALVRYLWRLKGLHTQDKQPGVWEDNFGPVIMSAGIVCAAAIVLFQAFDQLAQN